MITQKIYLQILEKPLHIHTSTNDAETCKTGIERKLTPMFGDRTIIHLDPIYLKFPLIILTLIPS